MTRAKDRLVLTRALAPRWPRRQDGDLFLREAGLESHRVRLALDPLRTLYGVTSTVAKTATIETNKGTIVADLFDGETPNTVANFEKLANTQFYDGTPLSPGHQQLQVIQAATALEGPQQPPRSHRRPRLQDQVRDHTSTPTRRSRHALHGARRGRTPGESQFFICHVQPQPHLDRVTYRLLGQVREGMGRRQQHQAERCGDLDPGGLS